MTWSANIQHAYGMCAFNGGVVRAVASYLHRMQVCNCLYSCEITFISSFWKIYSPHHLTLCCHLITSHAWGSIDPIRARWHWSNLWFSLHLLVWWGNNFVVYIFTHSEREALEGRSVGTFRRSEWEGNRLRLVVVITGCSTQQCVCVCKVYHRRFAFRFARRSNFPLPKLQQYSKR